MNWITLSNTDQLDSIKQRSHQKPQIIFKHSTTCPISSIAKSRLADEKRSSNADWYYLDLLSYRTVSNEVANRFEVYHESPQVIVLHNGEVVYDESHLGISLDEILKEVNSLPV